MNIGVPLVSARSADSIEAISRQIVHEVHLDTLYGVSAFPIHSYCEFGAMREDWGVEFCVAELSAGTEGTFKGAELDLDVKVYEALLRGDARARFTLAHELGHVVLHRQQLHRINRNDAARVSLNRVTEIPAFQNPEWQANRFAASLLMPIECMDILLDQCAGLSRRDTVGFICRRLGVSREAAEIRLDTTLKWRLKNRTRQRPVKAKPHQ